MSLSNKNTKTCKHKVRLRYFSYAFGFYDVCKNCRKEFNKKPIKNNNEPIKHQ